MTALGKLIGKPPEKRSPLEQCIVDATKLEDLRDGEFAMMERAAEDLENLVNSGGAGELVRAAQEILELRSKIQLIILPYQEQMEGLNFALTDLEAAVQKIQQGSASKAPDVGN